MNPTEHLTELFMRFPGIGPKQAKRFVYFLLRENIHYKQDLIRTIEELKHTGKQCEQCFRFYGEKNRNENNLCEICSNESRDETTIMIVEKELDIDAIERSGSYNGIYFVLGGTLPLFVEKPSEHIRVRELTVLLHLKLQEKTLREIIFALPVTDVGDSTKEYLIKTISQIVGIKDVKISSLARGLSSGLELEYVDKATFKSAFDRRD